MDTPYTMASSLVAAGAKAVVQTRAIVQKGALNIKTEGRNNALKSAPTRNARAPYAITYDTNIAATTVEAEIGYDKNLPGGSLGNLLEYGSRNNPAHRDLGRAADAEEPRFEQAITLMATGLLN